MEGRWSGEHYGLMGLLVVIVWMANGTLVFLVRSARSQNGTRTI